MGNAELAGEIRVTLSKLSRRLREQAHAADLTGAQKSALLRLERDGPATVTTLARAEGGRPQSMGATVAVTRPSMPRLFRFLLALTGVRV